MSVAFDHQQAQPRGQSRQLVPLKQSGQQSLQPGLAGSEALADGLIADRPDGRINQGQVGGDFAFRMIQSGIEQDSAQQFRHSFDFARPGESLELTRQARCFRRQVL